MNNTIKALSDKLDMTVPRLVQLDRYWHGEQPAAYLTPDARDALGDRLKTLSVNFPRLAVTALAERLEVTGFRTDGPDAEPDADLWRIWRRNGMEDAAAQAHIDALAYGRSFVIVWADRTGAPVLTVESPLQVAVLRDPATRQVTAALKRWVDNGIGRAVLERLVAPLRGQHLYLFTDDRADFYAACGFRPRGTGLERVDGHWLGRFPPR